MQTFDKAAFSPAGAGRTTSDRFGRHTLRITADQTGGRLGLFEAEVPPGEGPPFHIHETEDECFRVLSGTFTFWCGTDCVTLSEGGVILVPRGAAHRFQNTGSTPGRLMTIMTPGGFEGFFPACEAAQPETPEQVGAIAARYNLRFVPPPMTEAA